MVRVYTWLIDSLYKCRAKVEPPRVILRWLWRRKLSLLVKRRDYND